MKPLSVILPVFVMFIAFSCSSSVKMSPEKMLSLSGREIMPTQSEFPEDGAIILYDNFRDRLYLDSDWQINVEQKRHRSILYFNDKADNWTTFSIYLDPDIKLMAFYARTIKPNGEIIELNEKDLHPTSVQPDFIAFSDDKSVKFTFPGVESGCVLEYSYTLNHFDSFYSGDLWPVQASIPKLYTRFTVELPAIFFRYKYNWTYSPKNIDLGPPESIKNLMNERSTKNRSQIYYWELSDIPALEYEPNAPPYRDRAMYVNVDLKYKSWNELSKNYWKIIQKHFDITSKPYIKELALEIAGNAEDEESKIRRVYEYTQQKYRYLATNIGQSGYIPHDPKDIIKNKYGDCKDMSTLNVTLLNALGIDAYPALINTKSKGRKPLNLISYDFNHMITYVKTKSGKEFWLDATGSSCPLGEVYPQIEDVDALVIYNDGKSKFIKLPKSKYSQNITERNIKIDLHEDGSAVGLADILFTGNNNLSFRSGFKDASDKDMRSNVEGWVNANTPNLTIDSLNYDDPSTIEDEFRMTIYFHKEDFASNTGSMLIFKPGLFDIDSKLDRYRDIERKYSIVFDAPYKINDLIEIRYNHSKLKVSALTKSISCLKPFTRFRSRSYKTDDHSIIYKQSLEQKHTRIPSGLYNEYREVLKSVAKTANENIVLSRK